MAKKKKVKDTMKILYDPKVRKLLKIEKKRNKIIQYIIDAYDIDMEMLEKIFEKLEDEIDLKAARKAMKDPEPNIPLEDVLKDFKL